MTEISNNAPEQDRPQNPVTISFTDQQGRKIDFHKPCLDQFTIERRVEHGPWQVLASNTRLPYVDNESFETAVHLEYRIKIGSKSGSSDEYFLKASIH